MDRVTEMKEDNSKIEDFFRKIGKALMKLGNISRKTRKGKEEAERGEPETEKAEPESVKEIPSLLKNFFEERQAGWPEYVILKLQICLVLLFAVSVLFSIPIIGGSKLFLIPVIVLLSIYTVYLLVAQIKHAFEHDYPAYRGFVSIALILIVFVISVGRYFFYITQRTINNLIYPIFLIFGAVIAAYIVFRAKYGRNYTFGTVISEKDGKANIKVKYDIRSNMKNGVYLLETTIDVDEGDRVKVGVDRSALGLRGSEPTEILEKVE